MIPADHLIRLRANPRTVRVSIRRVGARMWRVTVASQIVATSVEAEATGPRKALAIALRAANELEMPGIDLGMGWAYEHPQGCR